MNPGLPYTFQPLVPMILLGILPRAKLLLFPRPPLLQPTPALLVCPAVWLRTPGDPGVSSGLAVAVHGYCESIHQAHGGQCACHLDFCMSLATCLLLLRVVCGAGVPASPAAAVVD